MNWIDKRDGLSREGSGRVGVWKQTNLVHSYTLEWHYTTMVKPIKADVVADNKINEVAPENNANNTVEQSDVNKTPESSIEVFEDVGKAIWWGLLDLINCNPESVISQSEYKSFDGVRKAVEKLVEEKMGIRGKTCRAISRETNISFITKSCIS